MEEHPELRREQDGGSSLILGAGWGDGTTKDRFFNGTVYDFRVFDTALTDAQITTLMEAN